MATPKETEDKYKESIAAHFHTCERYPAVVIPFNFRREVYENKAMPRWFFDIKVVRYLGEKGLYQEGDIRERNRLENYSPTALKKHPRTNPLGLSSRTGGPKGTFSHINKDKINRKCMEINCDYRLYSISPGKLGKPKTGVFWNPRYGYARSSISLKIWFNKPYDPFLINKSDEKCINDIKLCLHDNNLNPIFELSSSKVFRDANNKRKVELFCKVHEKHNKVFANGILKDLSFNCSGCRQKDFGGVRRLHQLKANPEEDLGRTWLYFIEMEVKGIATLKIGVTSIKLRRESIHASIDRRYSRKNEIVKEVILSKAFKTELMARQAEQRILMGTLKFINEKVSPDFSGYTECRANSKLARTTCSLLFAEETH